MKVNVVNKMRTGEIRAQLTLRPSEWESLVHHLRALQDRLTRTNGRPVGQMFGDLADLIETEFDNYDDTQLFKGGTQNS